MKFNLFFDLVNQLSQSLVSRSLNVGCLGSTSGLEYIPVIQEIIHTNNELDIVSAYLNVCNSTNINILMKQLQVREQNNDQLISTFFNTENPSKQCFPSRLLHILVSYNVPYKIKTLFNISSLMPNSAPKEESIRISQLAQQDLTQFLDIRYRELTINGVIYLVLVRNFHISSEINEHWQQTLARFNVQPRPHITLPFYAYNAKEIHSVFYGPHWKLLSLDPVNLSHQSIGNLNSFHNLTYEALLLGLRSSPWGINKQDYYLHGVLAYFFRLLKLNWSSQLDGWVVVAKKNNPKLGIK